MKITFRKSLRTLLTALLFCLTVCCVRVCASTIQGEYPTQKGTILVTSDWTYRMIPTGHAAIVWDENHVIEAQTAGVMWGKNNWMSTRREVYGLKVKETTPAQDAAAAEWCKGQIGKSYNYNFLNKRTRDSFYCSQLVWAAFYDLFDIDLSDIGW